MKHTYTSQLQDSRNILAKLHSIRKVKLFYKQHTLTVVAYYKQSPPHTVEFTGKAYIIDLLEFKTVTIALAHTTHSPPKNKQEINDEEQDIDQEEEVGPPLPAIGSRLIPA